MTSHGPYQRPRSPELEPGRVIRPQEPDRRRRIEAQARQAGTTAAGFVIILLALAAWAVAWSAGGRELTQALLAGDVSQVGPVAVIFGGLFGFGAAFILGLGWTAAAATWRRRSPRP